MVKVFLRWTFLVGATLLLTGCMGAGTVPVSGTATLEDGTPLKSGSIEFTTEDLSMAAIGEIGEGGAYTIELDSSNPGCPPGKYKVVVTGTDPAVSEHYSSAETTDITVEVSAGTTDYPLKLKKG
ncbi:MAG: hypothetical protein RIC55_33420 [Pirellulaceae bacterium]